MAQSIRKSICTINDALATVFKGAKYYGLAKLVGTDGKYRPVVDDKDVTFDDDFAVKVYHKVNGVRVSYGGGYGRSQDITNTFAMSAIVFNNEKITKLGSDEIATIIQSFISNINTIEVILPTDVVLNSEQIFSTEYRGNTYALPQDMSLMQFNYTVAITFKSGCFDLCPEDFSHCKNN